MTRIKKKKSILKRKGPFYLCIHVMILGIFTANLSCRTTEVSGRKEISSSQKNKNCISLTPTQQISPTYICTRKNKFRFQIGSRTLTQERSNYEDDLVFQIGQYLRQTPYPTASLEGSLVELWLSCHWLHTEECSLVAVIHASKGNIALEYPIDSQKWGYDPEKLLWLGREEYPAVSPQKLGFLKITARSGYHHQTLNNLLTESGLFKARGPKGLPLVKGSVGHWPNIMLILEPFSEFQVAQILKAHSHATMLIEDVTFIPADDLDGPKVKFYTTRLEAKHFTLD
jgi:hypothetical protein